MAAVGIAAIFVSILSCTCPVHCCGIHAYACSCTVSPSLGRTCSCRHQGQVPSTRLAQIVVRVVMQGQAAVARDTGPGTLPARLVQRWRLRACNPYRYGAAAAAGRCVAPIYMTGRCVASGDCLWMELLKGEPNKPQESFSSNPFKEPPAALDAIAPRALGGTAAAASGVRSRRSSCQVAAHTVIVTACGGLLEPQITTLVLPALPGRRPQPGRSLQRLAARRG